MHLKTSGRKVPGLSYIFKKLILVQYIGKSQDLLITNGNQDILLLEIQVGVVLKPLIYVLNLYNGPINSHHSRKVVELPINSQ